MIGFLKFQVSVFSPPWQPWSRVSFRHRIPSQRQTDCGLVNPLSGTGPKLSNQGVDFNQIAMSTPMRSLMNLLNTWLNKACGNKKLSGHFGVSQVTWTPFNHLPWFYLPFLLSCKCLMWLPNPTLSPPFLCVFYTFLLTWSQLKKNNKRKDTAAILSVFGYILSRAFLSPVGGVHPCIALCEYGAVFVKWT